MVHPSDSKVNVDIEYKIVKKLEEKYNCSFTKKREGSKFEFDFYNEEKRIIGEIYTGINTLKSAQKDKVTTDCFKLIAAEKDFGGVWKKYIVFVDEKIELKFKSNSWASGAIKSFDIILDTVPLSPEELKELREAKNRQRLGNQNKSI